MGTIEKWRAETDAIEKMVEEVDFTDYDEVKAFVERVQKLTSEICTYAETPAIVRNLQDKQIPR